MIFQKSHPAPLKIRRNSHYEKLTSESVLERQHEQSFNEHENKNQKILSLATVFPHLCIIDGGMP